MAQLERDPDANGLHNRDGNSFTDDLIDFWEEQQTAKKTGNEKESSRTSNDFFSMIDNSYDEMRADGAKKEEPEKSNEQGNSLER